MADRYWVGGTASWDGTAGTKWATTSGGTGGASVPTSVDDVFFTDLSTGTCTIATGNTGAKSINCTGFTGTITGTAAISVAGSITLSTGMTYTHTGTVTITATATLITAGKTFSGLSVSAGTVTLGDAINTGTRDLAVTGGTFDTAGYNLTAGRCTSAGGTRTILWRTSTVTVSGQFGTNFGSGLTFNAGTSSLILTGSDATMSNNNTGFTFYDVSFTSTAGTGRGLSPAAIYNNITIAGPSADSLIRVNLQGNVTVNGTLSITGTTPNKRVGFVSNIIGSARTLTVATLSADHCDFEDITLAGAASPASPTGAGNCGNNTNITFPSAKTVYRVGTNSAWGDASGWAASSGGTGSSTNFPLPQDTAIVDNATTGTTLTFGNYNRSSLDMSSRTNAITLDTGAFTTVFYGSFILGSGVTLSVSFTQSYRGRVTSTLSTAGKTLGFPLNIDAPGGTLQLGSALTSTASLTVTRGTFDAVSYNVTVSSFDSSNSNTRTVSMGSGLWTLTGTGGLWSTTTRTNLTFNIGTANVLLSNTSTSLRIIDGGGVSFNRLTIGGATGISTLNINGTNTFAEIASTKTVAHTISFGANQTIGTWLVTGTVGNVVTVNSQNVGVRRTITLTNATSGIDYLAVRDIGVSAANTFYVGANSTDNGNNLNVIFTAAPSGPATGNMFMLFT